MKLRRFDKNASSFKNSLNHKKDTYIKYGTLIFSFAVIVFIYVYFTRAAFNSNTDFSVINASVGDFVTDYTLSYYLDNALVNNAPTPTDDVAFDHITCDKNATATFDKGEWKVNIKSTEQGTKCKVYFVTDNNAWQLPGGVDLETGMTAIKFVDGKIYKADTSTKWYDYRNHEWANAAILTSTGAAKTTSQELDPTTDIYQMYVWIPRYAYKTWEIVDGSSEEHIIPIIFQSSTEKNNTSGYVTHPAFKFGNTELNGIWVGKFEPSSSTGIEKTLNQFCTTMNCQDASKIRILPNMIALTNNNIGYFFNAARSIESESTFGLDSTIVDSHMMKNTEWGAAAYLAHSIYGLFNYDGTCSNSNQTSTDGCTVYKNNINVGYGSDTSNLNNLSFSNGPTVTGCSGEEVVSEASFTTSQGDEGSSYPTCATNYKWNENGVLASSNGNITGIYDMSGGDHEYMMGNQSSSLTSYVFYHKNGIITQPDDKYLDKYYPSYNNTTDVTERLDQKRGILGDATVETLQNYGDDSASWYGGMARFVTMNMPWFCRGSSSSNGSGLGIFAFGRYTGGSGANYSFRIVITKEG